MGANQGLAGSAPQRRFHQVSEIGMIRNKRRVLLGGAVVGLLLAFVVGGCGSGTGQEAASPSSSSQDQGDRPVAGDGAPPVETLGGWKAADGAVIAATVTKVSRVPVDEPAPHRLYADRLVVNVDETLWESKDWAATNEATDGLRLYGPLWSKTDDGDFIAAEGDSGKGDGVEFAVGDRFVAAVVPSLKTAKDSWDIYLTDSTTVIRVIDGKLSPGASAPAYQRELAGVSPAEFAAMIADLPEPAIGGDIGE